MFRFKTTLINSLTLKPPRFWIPLKARADSDQRPKSALVAQGGPKTLVVLILMGLILWLIDVILHLRSNNLWNNSEF